MSHRFHGQREIPRTTRMWLAIAAIAGGAFMAAIPAARGGAAGPSPATGVPGARSVTYPTRTMGTYANVIIVTADSAAADPAARRAHAVFKQVDSLMSNWTTTSEVARINRVAALGPTTVEPQVAKVIDASLALWRASDGVFDITVEPIVRLWGFLGGEKRVPSDDEAKAAFKLVGAQRVHFDRTARTISFEQPGMKIDLGGIAKGYAVDEAAKSLARDGVTNALVDLTGNMAALGHPADADHWRIGIRDPRDRMRWFARVRLDPGQAISTSGKYEQFVAKDGRTYGHIIDPRTGWPAEGLISVTVIARTALDCDSWDTPLFVLGPAAAKRKARERADVAAVLVEPGANGIDTVWVEEALRDRFVLDPEARAMFRVEYL
jgi:FAD:protein FMN transferase